MSTVTGIQPGRHEYTTVVDLARMKCSRDNKTTVLFVFAVIYTKLSALYHIIVC